MDTREHGKSAPSTAAVVPRVHHFDHDAIAYRMGRYRAVAADLVSLPDPPSMPQSYRLHLLAPRRNSFVPDAHPQERPAPLVISGGDGTTTQGGVTYTGALMGSFYPIAALLYQGPTHDTIEVMLGGSIPDVAAARAS